MSITPSDVVGAVDAPDGEIAAPLERAGAETELLDWLIIVAARKKFIFKVTAAAMILAAGVSLLLPNWYTATTKILPPQQNQSLASALMGQLGALGSMTGAAQSLGLTSPNAIYVSMLGSRTVEDALIRRFDLMAVYRAKRMSDARKSLEQVSSISVGTKDNVITVSVEDKDRRRAAAIANAYVEELRKLTRNLALTEAGQRRVFFEEQLELARNRLSDAEQSLMQTQQRTGVIQLDSQAKAIIESVVRFKAEIAVKEVQLRAMRSFATEQNPDLIRTEQELAGMRSQLASLQNQSGGAGEIQIATGKVPEVGLEYVRRVREVKYYETIFELLAKQFEAAKLDESRSAAVIQVLDPAVEPDRKSSPIRSLVVAIMGLLAFLGSILYVSIDEKGDELGLSPRIRALKEAIFAR